MRSNPNVCFEVESIESHDKWTCALVTGVFHEFTSPEDKDDAWGLLHEHNDWWEADRKPHFFSISMDAISGRQAI